MKTIITYGTYDLFHIGHLALLQRAKAMGDRLIVGISTDEFNELKGKRSFFPYRDRMEIVQSLKCVDAVIPEENWEQKVLDVQKHNVDVFVMGSDWSGKFDTLKAYCDVVYLDRTDGISSTEIRNALSKIDENTIKALKFALDTASSLVNAIK